MPTCRFPAPLLLLASMLPIFGVSADAAIRAEKIHVADGKKNEFYLEDGIFVGGDRAITGVGVKDVRRAPNAGYERIVIDLQGNHQGEPAVLKRAPYYQIAVNPEEEQVVLTLWGKPRLDFDPRAIKKALLKSPNIESVELLPRLDDEIWTFSLGLKGKRGIEVFELTQPARIIVDIRTPGAKAAAPHAARASKAKGHRSTKARTKHKSARKKPATSHSAHAEHGDAPSGEGSGHWVDPAIQGIEPDSHSQEAH